MGLGTVEVFLLIAVFAPLFTGTALVDLLDRAAAPLDITSGAATWAVTIVCLPVIGPALYAAIGRQQVAAELRRPDATVITGAHPIAA